LIERACAAAAPQLRAARPVGQLSRLQVPVLLLHGRADPIIPSIELRWLARDVPAPWLRAALVTPLLRHAEFPEPPKLRDAWRLVRFIKQLFDAAGSAATQVSRAGGGELGGRASSSPRMLNSNSAWASAARSAPRAVIDVR
jgi:hypothetical protein